MLMCPRLRFLLSLVTEGSFELRRACRLFHCEVSECVALTRLLLRSLEMLLVGIEVVWPGASLRFNAECMRNLEALGFRGVHVILVVVEVDCL